MTTTRVTPRALALVLVCVLALATGAPALASSPSAPAGPRLVDYTAGSRAGVEITRSSQVSRLRGAPADFKAFIGRLADTVRAGADCEAYGVSVQKVRSDGFAVGGVFECGGYQAFWARVDGVWREIHGTQDEVTCRVLRRYAVPSSIGGTACLGARGAQRAYHHA